MKRIVQRHQGGPPRADDAACFVEQVVTVMKRRDRRERSTPSSGVLGGAVPSTIEAAALGPEAVLARSILRMSGTPGSIVRGIGHRLAAVTVD
jgi:hypothetical protein